MYRDMRQLCLNLGTALLSPHNELSRACTAPLTPVLHPFLSFPFLKFLLSFYKFLCVPDGVTSMLINPPPLSLSEALSVWKWGEPLSLFDVKVDAQIFKDCKICFLVLFFFIKFLVGLSTLDEFKALLFSC